MLHFVGDGVLRSPITRVAIGDIVSRWYGTNSALALQCTAITRLCSHRRSRHNLPGDVIVHEQRCGTLLASPCFSHVSHAPSFTEHAVVGKIRYQLRMLRPVLSNPPSPAPSSAASAHGDSGKKYKQRNSHSHVAYRLGSLCAFDDFYWQRAHLT
jgi:hypothetical protein